MTTQKMHAARYEAYAEVKGEIGVVRGVLGLSPTNKNSFGNGYLIVLPAIISPHPRAKLNQEL